MVGSLCILPGPEHLQGCSAANGAARAAEQKSQKCSHPRATQPCRIINGLPLLANPPLDLKMAKSEDAQLHRAEIGMAWRWCNISSRGYVHGCLNLWWKAFTNISACSTSVCRLVGI